MREVFVCKEGDIADGTGKVVADNGVEIGLFHIGGQYVAWRNHCPHSGGPVCQGKVMKRVEERLDDNKLSLGIHYTADGTLNIVCPWHGYEFDIKTGHHAGLDTLKLSGFQVRQRDGAVYVVVPG